MIAHGVWYLVMWIAVITYSDKLIRCTRKSIEQVGVCQGFGEYYIVCE